MDEYRDHEAWVATLVRALQDGTPVDLASGEDVDVSQVAGWPESRRLPGEALRAALLNPDVRSDPRGLLIRAAYVTGIADLADLRLSYGLHFDSCAFEQLADWSRMTVASLQLANCRMSGLTLNDTHIGGVLNLQGASLTNEGGVALSLDGADVKGDALLNLVTVTGGVRALGATIGSQFNLRDATLTNEGGVALGLDDADIKGSAFLDPVTVTGEVRAVGATIGFHLNLQGATLTNEGGVALYLDGADIKAGVFLDLVNVTGEVRALQATIGGQLNLRSATLTNKGGDALALDRADIKGGAALYSATAIGGVRALGATIGSQFIMEDATLTNEGGSALGLEAAQLGDSD